MSVDIEYRIIWCLSTGLITSTLSGPKGNSELYFPSTSMFSEAPRETLRSRGNKTHCFPAGSVFKCYTSQLKTGKNCEKIVCFTSAGSQICRGFTKHDHVRVESSCHCFPRELVSFDPRHVTRSPPIGKRI